MQPSYVPRRDDEEMGDEGSSELAALSTLASGRHWRPARHIDCIADSTAEATSRNGLASCFRDRHFSGECTLSYCLGFARALYG